jgi:hypothetical protein
LIAFLLAIFAPAFFAALNSTANGQIFAVVTLPFAMILDAFVYAIFGNTPAKALGGIRVLDIRGQKVRLPRYLHRNFTVYVRGLGIGFPIVSLVTLLYSHRKASANKILSWDQELETRAFQIRSNAWRPYLVACLYFGGIAGLVALGTIRSEMSPQRKRSISHTLS